MKVFNAGINCCPPRRIMEAIGAPPHVVQARVLVAAVTERHAADLMRERGMHPPALGGPEFRQAAGNDVDALNARDVFTKPIIVVIPNRPNRGGAAVPVVAVGSTGEARRIGSLDLPAPYGQIFIPAAGLGCLATTTDPDAPWCVNDVDLGENFCAPCKTRHQRAQAASDDMDRLADLESLRTVGIPRPRLAVDDAAVCAWLGDPNGADVEIGPDWTADDDWFFDDVASLVESAARDGLLGDLAGGQVTAWATSTGEETDGVVVALSLGDGPLRVATNRLDGESLTCMDFGARGVNLAAGVLTRVAAELTNALVVLGDVLLAAYRAGRDTARTG